jgi:transcriptional regulator with XRE-family HTH domain
MLSGADHIATILRDARHKKNLSQRDLSAVSGVPQSHISKIEKGAVDLRLSSLVELARALDLEVTLVPRAAVPAVQSIVRSAASASTSNDKQTRLARKDLNRIEETIARNRSTLPFTPEEMAELQQQLRLLSHRHLSEADRKTIQSAYKTIRIYLADHENLNKLRQAFARLKDLRNRVVHGRAPSPAPEPVPPAYTLDEDVDA